MSEHCDLLIITIEHQSVNTDRIVNTNYLNTNHKFFTNKYSKINDLYKIPNEGVLGEIEKTFLKRGGHITVEGGFFMRVQKGGNLVDSQVVEVQDLAEWNLPPTPISSFLKQRFSTLAIRCNTSDVNQ